VNNRAAQYMGPASTYAAVLEVIARDLDKLLS
jgi:hypothetical protein